MVPNDVLLFGGVVYPAVPLKALFTTKSYIENHEATIHGNIDFGSHQYLECKHVQGNQIESEIEDLVEREDKNSHVKTELVETDYEELEIQSDDGDGFEGVTEDPVEREDKDLHFEKELVELDINNFIKMSTTENDKKEPLEGFQNSSESKPETVDLQRRDKNNEPKINKSGEEKFGPKKYSKCHGCLKEFTQFNIDTHMRICKG